MFRKKHPPLVGIDLGSSAIKLVELSRSGETYRVERFAIEPMPAGAIIEHAVVDIELVGTAIDRVLRRCGSKRRNAAVAIAASHVITRTIGMPAGLKPGELESQIEVEVDHYIPYPLDEVNLDFEVIGPSADNPNEDDVVITACRKEIVDAYIAAVERSGLNPAIIDVDAFALENVFPLAAAHLGGAPVRTVAILDFGVNTTRTNVIHDGRLVYTRDQAFGGKQLSDEAQRRFGMSDEEYRHARALGELPPEYLADIVEPFVSTMAQETNRALQFFYSSTAFDNVDHVLIMGGCGQIEGVDLRLSEHTGAPVSIMNPFVGTTLTSRVKPALLKACAPSLVIACGLALRSFV